jgi:hypothetical protein
MSFIGKLNLFLTLVVISTGFASAADKIIMTGWDSPTASQWRAQLPDVEKQAFFTGYVIKPTRLLNNKDTISWEVFTGDVWHWNEFKQTVADLSAVKPTIVKDNFLLVSANPGNIDFFDDAAWVQIVDHFKILARVAKVSGLKGLAFDAEPYTPPFKQFSYLSQSGNGVHSFEDYQAKAQQRGGEVLEAVQSEYPDIVILSYVLMSVLPVRQPPKPIDLSSNAYGLIPNFVDGMLDAAGPKVQFVEADENAYLFNTRDQFENTYMSLKSIPYLLNAQSRNVWKTKVKIGHSIYLDAYFNKPDTKYFVDSKKGTIGQRAAMNIVGALNASDGWALIYGEKGTWWKRSSSNYAHWLTKNGNLEYLRSLFVEKNVTGHALIKLADLHNDPVSLKDWTLSADSAGTPDSQCFSQQKNIVGDGLFSVRMLAETNNSSKFYSKVQWIQENGQPYPYFDPVRLSGAVIGSLVEYSALVRAPKKASAIMLSLCSTDNSITNKLSLHNLSVTQLLSN